MKYYSKFFIYLLFLSDHSILWANEMGMEVEITSAPVTSLSCALEAKRTGNLNLLTTCPMHTIESGFAIFDISEKQAYVLSEKNIHFFELEKAFGGGSIDLTGKIISIKNGFSVIDVLEYKIRAKPKAGSFKGCL